MELNKKLTELRKAKGLTQLELAELMRVSRQAVSRWEVGTASPSLDNLIYLSELYSVPLDDFIKDGASEPAESAVSPEDAPTAVPRNVPAAASRFRIPLISTFLAVLILGVGILIGMNLPRGKSPGIDPGIRVDVNGPVGWLEQTPTDVKDELQWLEATVKDMLEEHQSLP